MVQLPDEVKNMKTVPDKNSGGSDGGSSDSTRSTDSRSAGGRTGGGRPSGGRPGGQGGRSGGGRSGGPGGRGGSGGRRPFNRRRRRMFGGGKVCQLCVRKIKHVDYKDLDQLKFFVSNQGKILPRRMSGACARHQRLLTRAIKRAREIALLPYQG